MSVPVDAHLQSFFANYRPSEIARFERLIVDTFQSVCEGPMPHCPTGLITAYVFASRQLGGSGLAEPIRSDSLPSQRSVSKLARNNTSHPTSPLATNPARTHCWINRTRAVIAQRNALDVQACSTLPSKEDRFVWILPSEFQGGICLIRGRYKQTFQVIYLTTPILCLQI